MRRGWILTTAFVLAFGVPALPGAAREGAASATARTAISILREHMWPSLS